MARWISRFLLALVVALTIAPASAYAEGSTESITLDLSNGIVRISPTGYKQASTQYNLSKQEETPYTGAYVITGYKYSDSPLDIDNTSGSPATFNITLDNATIVAANTCTALRINGTSPITLDITIKGKSTIQTDSVHPAITSFNSSSVSVNITNNDSCLEITRVYGTPKLFSDSVQFTYNDSTSVSKDKKLSDHRNTTEYTWPSADSMTMSPDEYMRNAKAVGCVTKCPCGEETGSYTPELADSVIPSSCAQNGWGQYAVELNGETHVSPKYTLVVPHSTKHIDSKEPTCTEDGNIAYSLCEGCGEKTFEGSEAVIKATGHTFKDGVCAACGAADPASESSIHATKKHSGLAETGDDAAIALPALAAFSSAAIAAYTLRRRRA